MNNWSQFKHIIGLAAHCPICAGPVTSAAGVCDGCRGELPFLARSCRHCALPLAAEANTEICSDCAKRPRFDQAVAAFHYREPIAWLVSGLKYRSRLANARLLGDLLAECLQAKAIPAPDLIAAVPLHPAAFRRRGFNQAERIAARIERQLGWPQVLDAFERVRDTPRQSTLDAIARAANVRGAFAARPVLAGRHVAIVDDVMTTARTATELARCARKAGATRVDVFCVARA